MSDEPQITTVQAKDRLLQEFSDTVESVLAQGRSLIRDIEALSLTDTALDLMPLTRWQRFVRWLQWS